MADAKSVVSQKTGSFTITYRALCAGMAVMALIASGCTTETLSVPQDDETLTVGDDSTNGGDDGDGTTVDDGDATGDVDDTSTDIDEADDGTVIDDGDEAGDVLAEARILHVDSSATGAATGVDWVNAFTRLQDALAVAEATEQIRVAQGRYQPADAVDRDATFTMVDGVEVFGGYAGLAGDDPDARDVSRFETVLSGDLLDDDGTDFANTTDNARHVITVRASVESGLLGGVTVSGGYADGMSSDATGQGGGLAKLGGRFTLRDCRITGNHATVGGGARNGLGALMMVNCTVQDNTAQLTGGGIYVAAGTLTAVNTEVLRNHGPNGGGGIYAVSGKTNLHNVALVGNTTDYDGGGMYVQDGAVEATNVAVTANHVNRHGGGIFVLGGTCTLANCIVWANLGVDGTGLDAQIGTAAGTVTATYSCVGDENPADASIPYGGLASRNLDDDPRFLVAPTPGPDGLWDGADDEFGYLGFWPDSPCIDAGNTAALPLDSADADGDADTDETLPVDMVGATRIKSADVDLGPHEF